MFIIKCYYHKHDKNLGTSLITTNISEKFDFPTDYFVGTSILDNEYVRISNNNLLFFQTTDVYLK